MVQTKDKSFLKQLQLKSQNPQFHTPCSKFLATAKVGLADYDSFRGGGSHICHFLFLSLPLLFSHNPLCLSVTLSCEQRLQPYNGKVEAGSECGEDFVKQAVA